MQEEEEGNVGKVNDSLLEGVIVGGCVEEMMEEVDGGGLDT